MNNSSIYILKNAHVYAPRDLGMRNIVIVNDRVVAICEDTTRYENLEQARVFDCSGSAVVPGFIDLHEHILGGGGEGGPASRVREAGISDLIDCGVTTVLGLLGVDGISRSVENLVTKARALTQDGITCYALTSNYCYPNTTITGTVEKDIIIVDPIVGVKTAISDHRDSNISCEELTRMASEARRGGLLSGKAGLVVIHIGGGKRRLDKLIQAVRGSDIPIKHFLPTHVNLYDSEVLAQSEQFIDMGGVVDFTAGFNATELMDTIEKMSKFYRKHGDLNSITLSSDAFGSCPEYAEDGSVVRMKYATPSYLPQVLAKLVQDYQVPMTEALKPLTSNPARVLTISDRKGSICVGADADLVVLDKEMQVDSVFSRGVLAKEKKTVLLRGIYGGE